MSLLKWLIARPILIVVGIIAMLWLIFNYQHLGDIYLLAKYLILLGIGIYIYPSTEKMVGKTAKGGMKTFIALIIVLLTLVLLRMAFIPALIILFLIFAFKKGD